VIFGALHVTKVLSTEEVKRAIEGSGKDFGKSILKADIQFLKNYIGDFKKDSKLYNNVFSAIKKVGHRGYLSAKTAFLVGIGHIDGGVMLLW
jgi:hypothetical protein